MDYSYVIKASPHCEYGVFRRKTSVTLEYPYMLASFFAAAVWGISGIVVVLRRCPGPARLYNR